MTEIDPNYEKKIDKLEYNMEYVVRTLARIEKNLEDDYVTQDQFEPIRRIVYGLVSLILTGVVVALLTLVIKR